jgi:hypothetical protein
MPTRVQKTTSTQRRSQLAARIELYGNLMAPCSRCERLQLLCFVDDLHPKCSECVRSNTVCDGTWSDQEYDQIQQKRKELAKEMRVLRARIAADLAKVSSLEEAYANLGRQASLMVAREGSNLDLYDPPRSDGTTEVTSPTFSQILGSLGVDGGSGQ